MIRSIQVLYMLCILILGSIPCTAQSDAYEDYYNIFPEDSVVISIPKHSTSFFYTKKASKGICIQNGPNEEEFIITYKPNVGHFGLDTFQIVYFFPNPDGTELVKKSKKVVVRTSKFILSNDTFTFFRNDSNKILNVLTNDNIPGGNEKIIFLPTPTSNILEISDDSLSIILKNSTKACSETLSYVVLKEGQREKANFTITIVDSSSTVEDRVFQKFLVKNSTLKFVHPYVFNTEYTINNGAIEIAGNEISYTPDLDWTGQDTLVLNIGSNNVKHKFLLKVFDFAQPNILAFDDYIYTLKNKSVSFDLLSNDFAMVLDVSIVEQPEHGSLLKQGNGKYKYSPDEDFSGTDIFVYKACDLASNVCEFAIATITVSDFAPANTYTLTTGKNSPLKINYPFPTSGYKLSHVPSAAPKHGIVTSPTAQNDFIYRPSQNETGLDSMKIKYTLISDPSIVFVVKIYVDVLDIEQTCMENCIWPGDNNNDGRVDMKDLTFVAPFIGQTGDARQYPQNEYWVGQEGNDWDVSKDKINLKHGDSDGNGLIDPFDTTLLSSNYRNLHGIWVNKGVNSLFLPFDLRTDKDYYYPGDEITISFTIGGETWPIKDLNGFTASFNFSEAFNDASMTASFKENHWLSDNDQMLQMVKKASVRNLDFGSARISGKGVVGYGDVAVIKGIVDEELAGFKDDEEYYFAQIQINDGTLQLGDGTELRTAPQTFKIPIKVEKKGGTDVNKQVRIYPNPTQSTFEIAAKNPDNIINSVYIYSISGQNIISLNKINQNKVAVNLGKYPAGLYLVKTFTTTGVEINKVEKL